ncbi:MAG: hypothetical protein V1494_00155 [Candidatus Diapherotrites archaeon]
MIFLYSLLFFALAIILAYYNMGALAAFSAFIGFLLLIASFLSKTTGAAKKIGGALKEEGKREWEEMEKAKAKLPDKGYMVSAVGEAAKKAGEATFAKKEAKYTSNKIFERLEKGAKNFINAFGKIFR